MYVKNNITTNLRNLCTHVSKGKEVEALRQKQNRVKPCGNTLNILSWRLGKENTNNKCIKQKKKKNHTQ